MSQGTARSSGPHPATAPCSSQIESHQPPSLVSEMPPPKFDRGAAPSAAVGASAPAASAAAPPDSPSNPAIIIHTIDPDHYTTRKGEASSASDADDESGSPAVTPSIDDQANAKRRMQQLPSPAPAAAAASISHAHTTPSTLLVPAVTLASVTRRAFKEAAGGLGGSIFSACCVYPIDLVKTRIQMPNSPYTSLWNGLSTILREEGLLTLYTGLGSELIKASVQSFSYFYWYDERLHNSAAGPRTMRSHTRSQPDAALTHRSQQRTVAQSVSLSVRWPLCVVLRRYFIFKEAAVTRLMKQQERAALAAEGTLLQTGEGGSGFSVPLTALTRDSSTSRNAAALELKLHQQACSDPACFCRSDSHLAAHTEAHKRSQVDQWREKAMIHRRHKLESARQRAAKQAAAQQHQHQQHQNPHTDFDHNLFHPRMFPSVSEPSLALLQLQKHDLDDSPYVDVKSVENTALITNTATVLAAPASEDSSAASAATATVTSPSPPPALVVPQLSIGVTLLLGTVAGCLTQLVVNPVSVIQTRMMTQKKSTPGGAVAMGFFALAHSIWKQEGPSAFFAGILPAFILSTNPSIQFMVFDRLKLLVLRILSQSMVAPRSLSVLESFVLGAFSKIVATVVTYPYILAKTRLQSKAAGGGVVYKGTIDVIARTLKYEGVTGLFTGIQAQLLKSVLGAALVRMGRTQTMRGRVHAELCSMC